MASFSTPSRTSTRDGVSRKHPISSRNPNTRHALFSLLASGKIALDIDQEAADQNRYLEGMDSDFLSATGLLTGSVKRFSTMVRSGRDNKKLLCYTSVGLVILFFILYLLVTRMQT
ncbi:BET1-like protein isoform X5 [Narcine bancroftii]|uniref:BET1-like protein isoform X5 n=1 Tax=Narcine bancroftii TaxID=1343680 RepID=UPI003831042D